MFSSFDCFGLTPLELLKRNFPDAVIVDDEKQIKGDKKPYAVLYADTPLVTMEDIDAFAEKGITRVGGGYIKNVAGQDAAGIFQIKSNADLTKLRKEVKKLALKRFESRVILFYDIESCNIDFTAEICDGAVIHPWVNLKGKTVIGKNTVVYSFCDLTDTVIGENSDIRSTFAVGAKIGSNTTVGPFATLRSGAVIGDHCRVGDYVEVKNATLGDYTKAAHLAYIGDATIGKDTNVGCGTVFANYNGIIKQHTTVGDNVFIGANTNLIAPVLIEDEAYIAAGSTVTHDVQQGELCIARARQVVKQNYIRK